MKNEENCYIIKFSLKVTRTIFYCQISYPMCPFPAPYFAHWLLILFIVSHVEGKLSL